MMHNTSDLKVCYDRHLPNVGCMVQETVGVERKPSQIFAKALPIMNHHTCKSFDVSKKKYGSKFETLGGTRQGNSVSGSISKHASCIIFKHLEGKKLEVTAVSPINKNVFQRIAIVFVDETDFCTSGEKYETKMQQIIDQFITLCEATGGKIQQDK